MLTLPSQVHTALDRLTAAGWEAYVVGGAVRDALRGCAAGDWDITTNAEPAQVERVFAGERLIETGLRHGTVTVLLDGLPRHAALPDHRADAVQLDRPHAEPVGAVALPHPLQPGAHLGVAERPLVGDHCPGVLQDRREIRQVRLDHPTERQALRRQHEPFAAHDSWISAPSVLQFTWKVPSRSIRR